MQIKLISISKVEHQDSLETETNSKSEMAYLID